MRRRDPTALPASARHEVACALSRRLHDSMRGRHLPDGLLHSPLITEMEPGSLPETAPAVGTESSLRASDAFYAAVATDEDGIIISWDEELLRPASTVTPSAWLSAHGKD